MSAKVEGKAIRNQHSEPIFGSALSWIEGQLPNFFRKKVEQLKVVTDVWRLWKNSDRFVEQMYSAEKSFALFDAIKSDFADLLEESEWKNLHDRIQLVFDEFADGLSQGEQAPEVAFCIHQREREADIMNGNPYDDATAFSVEIQKLIRNAQTTQVSQERLVTLRKKLAQLIDTFPAFRAAVIDIEHNENAYKGAVICIPITVDDLSLPDDTPSAEKVRIQEELISRVIVGLKFMKKLGIRYIGLGAVLPRITGMGELVRLVNTFEKTDELRHGKKPSPSLEYTTGHGMTVALMIETMYVASEKNNLDVADSTMAIIGSGYIGRSFVTSLYKINERPLPKKVILYDVIIGRAQKTKMRLEKLLGDSASKVEIVIYSPTGNSENDINSLIDQSQIIFGAATHGKQITYSPSDHNTKIFIDDSQPTLFARFTDKLNEMNKHLYWPTAHSRNGYHRQAIDVEDGKIVTTRSSSYGEMGLVPAELVDFVTFWGCELENFLLFLLSKDRGAKQFSKNAVQEPVTPAIVLRMRGIFKRYSNIVDTQMEALQSYGRLS